MQAIQARDVAALADTVHPEDVVLVAADGAVRLGRDAFLAMHGQWFESTSWKLDADVIHLRAGADLATALLDLRYRDGDIDERSVLSLVFRKEGNRWLMVQDQNTPVR